MNASKTMKWVGTAVFLLFALGNVLMILITSEENTPFGPEIAGPYSIFASYKFFMAYHVWGIVVAVITTYAMWKETRMLFWIGLLLMMILMFYPYFTSSPNDKAKGEQIKAEQEQKDSINRDPGLRPQDTSGN